MDPLVLNDTFQWRHPTPLALVRGLEIVVALQRSYRPLFRSYGVGNGYGFGLANEYLYC